MANSADPDQLASSTVCIQVSSLLIDTRPTGPSVTTYSTIPTNNVTADCDMQTSFYVIIA